MIISRNKIIIAGFIMMLLSCVCGITDTPESYDAAGYFPLKVGNYWKYKLTYRDESDSITDSLPDTLYIKVMDAYKFDDILYYDINTNHYDYSVLFRINGSGIYSYLTPYASSGKPMYDFSTNYIGEYFIIGDITAPIWITQLGYNRAIFKREIYSDIVEEKFLRGVGIVEIKYNNNKYSLIDYKIN
jgi:hypothetical protein